MAMESNVRERLDANPANVIACCPKCYYGSGRLEVLSVSDNPANAHCDACGDYAIADLWVAAAARREAQG